MERPVDQRSVWRVWHLRLPLCAERSSAPWELGSAGEHPWDLGFHQPKTGGLANQNWI